MANAHRGEVEALLDGKTFRLCLTLGALAELEAAFGDDDMLALAARFEKGRLSASDCVRVIGAGLRGAGYEIRDSEVAAMQTERGAAGYVEIVAKLLRATFGGPEEAGAANPGEAGAANRGEAGALKEASEPGPFPGTR